MIRQRLAYTLLLAVISMAVGTRLYAQQFKVASFKVLPNDVSAFIDPVRDLNDDDCGLVKVIGSGDFAFSTPLGIVKRVDKVGEIWLYLPRGSRKITIKHAEWGVLRDYTFPQRIDSHITYELRIDEPVRAVEMAAMPEPVVKTVRDTLVLTRVDTLVVLPVKKPVPMRFGALATAVYGGKSKTLMAGVRLFALKKHGGFVHVATDFGSVPQTIAQCDKIGEISGAMPFYTGRTRHSAFMVNAGAVQRLSEKVAIFEGVGYSSNAIAWELAPSEGGGYVKNTHYSCRSVSFEAGAMVSFNRIAVSASVVSSRGKDWYGSIGIGIKLGK